jgi:glycosyltransferase involved in cell wall biosynthesis
VIAFLWENLTLEGQGLKAHLLEYLARFNRRYIDFFICGNSAGREILADRGIPDEKIAVIPQHGVDPDVFYPYSAERKQRCRLALGIAPNEFAVGFVGRFVEEKGILDLVDVIFRLRATSLRPIVLVLTGSGELEETIRTRSKELGIRLIVQRASKYYDVADTMNALEVLVLPSQSRPFWKEQFGRVLIEAMACGTCVIGSDSGEIPKVIGDAGMIFREGDSAQLRQCLRLCCENAGFTWAMARRGLERAVTNFTNQRIAEQTLEVYRHVLGSVRERDRALGVMASSTMSRV